MKTRDELLAENEENRLLLVEIFNEEGRSERFVAAQQVQRTIYEQIADLDAATENEE